MENTLKKILVVDDNPDNLGIVNGILKDLYKVYRVNSGETALQFLEKQRPDLILLDVKMPEMSGYELIKILKSDPKLCEIPVIFLTALHDTQSEVYAFELGAADYIQKPFNNVIVKARVKQHLEMESYRGELQKLVDIKTSQITQLQKVTLNLLAYINEFRDQDTGNHVKRAVGYVCVLMDHLPKNAPESYHISSSYYEDIKNSTPLHDIGKICVPDSILLKPGPLTDEEFEVMKKHVTKGGELLQNAIEEFNGPSFLDVALEIVLTHHEKWNGTGYPYRLSGEKIPISGRIMALADVYDALTSKRPYKPAFSHEKAMEIIMDSSGTHFDPALVEVFVSSQDDILRVLARDGVGEGAEYAE